MYGNRETARPAFEQVRQLSDEQPWHHGQGALMQNRDSDSTSQKCDALQKATWEYLKRDALGPQFDPEDDEFRGLVTKYGCLVDELELTTR